MSGATAQTALLIARAEHDHWMKEALRHKRPGGRRSDHAESDLERARIAKRIADKIEAAISTSSNPAGGAE